MPTAVWDPTTNSYKPSNDAGSGVGAYPSSSTAAVLPGLSYDQWVAEQALQAGQLGVNQTQARTGQQNAYTSLLTMLAQTLPLYHGPQNWGTYANLTTGQPHSGTLGFYESLAKRAAPFQYGDINGQTPLDPFGFDNVNGPYPNDGEGGDGSSSGVGGGSGSDIAWKQKRKDAGITADASNPEVDRLFKSGNYTPEQGAQLASLTASQPMQASAFYGPNQNRDPEGVPYLGKPILDPQTLAYRDATSTDIAANQRAAANDRGNQNADSRNQNSESRGGTEPSHGAPAADIGPVKDSTPEHDTNKDTRPQYAQGGLSVVRQPTQMAVGGQPAVVGEHGRDELVLNTPQAGAVFPLQNPGVAVNPLIAKIAEQIVHGHQGYRAHAGVDPGMLNPSPGVQPVHLESGGQIFGGNQGAYGSPVSQGATVHSANKPYDNGAYISDTGQAQVPFGSEGGFKEVPAWQTLPVLNPLQQDPELMRRTLANQDLLGMLQSTLGEQGQSWSSWYQAYANSLPWQNRTPAAARWRSGAF